MRLFRLLPAIALGLTLYSTGRAADEWVDITGSLAGRPAGPGGVTLVAAVPGSIELIAAVSEKGLFSSSDLGASWQPMGTGIALRPTQILFDPDVAKTFWVAGTHGPGPFVTRDGGLTFKRLGAIEHAARSRSMPATTSARRCSPAWRRPTRA